MYTKLNNLQENGLVVFPSGDSLFRASPQLSRSATVTSTQGEKNVVLHDTGDL